MACPKPLPDPAPLKAVRAATAREVRKAGLRVWGHHEVVHGAIRREDEAAARAAVPMDLVEEPPALAALRLEARRLRAIAEECFEAASALEGCGRALVQYECRGRESHLKYLPKWCGRSALCPDCARVAAERLRALYLRRVMARMEGAPSWFRARLLTLAIKARETETPRDTVLRQRRCDAQLYRVLWLVPSSADDWRIHFELFPLGRNELARIPDRTPGGRPRREATRVRLAKAARRRVLLDRRRRDGAGVVRGVETAPQRGNVHSHALVLGRYVHYTVISRAWKLITSGESYIIDVRAVRPDRGGLAGAVDEVVKYITKFTAREPDQLAGLYVELLSVAFSVRRPDSARCLRRVEAFGSLRLPPDEERAAETVEPEVSTCEICGAPTRPVGILTLADQRAGLLVVPTERRFKPRARGSPGEGGT